MDASAITSLTGLGAAGAVILAMFYYLQHEARRDKARAENELAVSKLRAENDQKVIDRIDQIVDRHLASEAANRSQIGEMSEANRMLFDRVIGICLELSNTIKELTASSRANEASSRANEKAIIDLRAEFRHLSGPAAQKSIGQDDPRPFASG